MLTRISIPLQPPYVCWISMLLIFFLLFYPQEWYMIRKLRNLGVQKIFNLYLNDKGKQVLFRVLGCFSEIIENTGLFSKCSVTVVQGL